MPEEIPPHLQNQARRLQEYDRELQVVVQQRAQFELQLRETERTLEEISKLEDGAPIYRSVGSLLFRVKDREGLRRELEDQKEITQVRLQSSKNQEERLKERVEALRREIEAALRSRSQTPT